MNWQNRLSSALGIYPNEHIELAQRMQHLRSSSIIIICALLVFAVYNLATPGMSELGMVELFSLLVFFIPAALLGKQPLRIGIAEAFLLTGGVTVCTALYLLGGVEGTGPYWVYSLPFLSFFIKGQRKGWFYSLAFLGFIALFSNLSEPYLPWAYPFSDLVRVQFLLSLFFYTLVAAAFNHARIRYEALLQQRHSHAEAASRSKSRFLAAASHDLRQPAHALGLFVARLNQLPQSEPTRELIVGVDASVRALQEMLDAFFDYSRLDSQLTQAHLQDFAINDMLDKLRNSFADTCAQKGVRLRVRPCRHWVHSDPVLLQRILLNLVSNAVQHSHQGSVLLGCRASADGKSLRIEVRDNGVGIAAEHHQKIFEEFYQVENRERDRSKGLGLGLSIVERSCKLLEHPISLNSRLGEGACFAVQVARVRPPPAAARATQQPPAASDAMENGHILLIEDDALGSVALKGLLESWGFKVTLADSAEAACASILQAPPVDFVVSDFRLPGETNGVDAVHMIRAQTSQSLPACIISGDIAAEVRALIQSADLVLLQKPVRPAKLRAVLRQALNRRERSAA